MGRDGREVWAKRVERWKDSGLTAREFAAEVGVNEHTLSSWRRRLAAEGEPDRPETAITPTFVEIVGAAGIVDVAPAASEPLEVVLPGGLRIRVPARFHPASLLRLVATLESR